MAVTHQPIFIQSVKTAKAVIAAANTARDGSGSIVSGPTIGSNGGKVRRIEFTSSQATAAANSAMICRIWFSLDAGSTWTLKDELSLPAVTASNTVAGAEVAIDYDDWGIDANAIIGVTQSIYAGVQDRVVAKFIYGDY